ncbi:MAG TPA: methyltransferase domain-containing protein [Anaerolineales bacterium]
MNLKPLYYPESRFAGFSDVDGTITFYNRVNALIRPSNVVVDIGCGRGAYGDDPIGYRRRLRILKGKCQSVIGVDVDLGAEQNPFIDEFRCITAPRWPVESRSIDLCVSDNVLEHIQDPQDFFAEVQRILKPGGFICIRTPNVWSYFGLVSKLVPNRRHTDVLEKVKDRLSPQDVFPTLYRCNTIGCIRKSLQEHGFEHTVYGYDAEPSYLSFSRWLYFLGVLHQRFAPQIFKVGIHAFGRKLT